MDRQEAIERIKQNKAAAEYFAQTMGNYGLAENELKDIEAFNMAIEALQDDWIPVSEPPKENGNYIVSLEDSVYPWGGFFNGKWFMLSADGIAREFSKHEVRAWKPLPEPYKENK